MVVWVCGGDVVWQKVWMFEEEINKEAQTFIKAVGDFLANAVEVGFLPSWFYKIYVNQKRIKFFENFDTMYD